MPRRPDPPDQEPVEFLTPAHVQAMEDAAHTMRDALLVRLLFRSGCRISEALALTPEDVNFQARLITIKHLKERIHLKCPHCNERLGRRHKFCAACGQAVPEPLRQVQEQHSRRVVPIDQATADMLREFVKRKGCRQFKGRLVFFPFGRDWANKLLAQMADAAGIPQVLLSTGKVHHVSAHRLRDAHATHFVDSVEKQGGGDAAYRLLQEQLGHSKIETTFKYRKVATGARREAYDSVFGDGGEEATVEETDEVPS